MKKVSAWLSLILFASAAFAAGKHPFTSADLHRIRDVSEPALSPDGASLVYTVTQHNVAADRAISQLWRASYDGKQTRQLTFTENADNYHAQWSPNGLWLAFLSDRGEDEITQVWLMPSDGGEARKLTELKGGVSDFVWAPDSKQLALIASDDPDPDSTAPAASDKKNDTAKPIVLDRYQFKDDDAGYLTRQRQHLYLFDIATSSASLLTPGDHDEWTPAWAPDGRNIVYVSKRGADPDRHFNYDLYLIEPRIGSKERQLTKFNGDDHDPSWGSRPSWSPDSRQVAYLRGDVDHWIYYAPFQLAVADVTSGKEWLPAPIDRSVTVPKWSADGKSIYILIEQSRNTFLSRVTLDNGKVDTLTTGSRFDVDIATGVVAGKDRVVLLSGDDVHPPELFALENTLRPLSQQNVELLAQVQFQPAEDISFKSKDGTSIDGFLMKPVGYQTGKKYPTILDIHGGPVYQFSHEFLFRWQWYAAHGYAVVAANPRGSSGRGFEFAKAIYADWGNLDVQDVLAAVDHAVALGVTDPQRLAVNGWSYGSILTNYVISQVTRFKAATSGAGSSNFLTMYGLDEYIREYEIELGRPWEHPEVYLRLSSPFLHADRIKTPTLFFCAEKDFNVPCEGAEQMYQALRSLNTPTRLVIYPNEHHDLDVPSYLADRLQRYTDWYDKYLK